MEQLMEQRALNGSFVGEVVAEKVNYTPLDSARYVVIACDTRQDPESGIPDPNRRLMRKLTDSIFNFIGYHRVSDPFRNKQWD